MNKRYQIFLLVPLSLFVLVIFYRSGASPTTLIENTSRAQPVVDSLENPTDVDFDKHVELLKKRLPSSDFTVIVQRPFVVIGDESEAQVKEHSEKTVKWAVDKLKQDFFTKDPKEILDIWLFKDAESYQKNTLALFGERPGTPYGYYSPTHKALIMNISTGGGTLVHEIVHPFVEANFPNCPSWFNEGLGSLYEQAGEVNGHIHGYPNWRLPALQKAIRAGKVPEFKSLMALSAHGFYDEDKGTNYGQARYLCYYLQQRGLLMRFYREFTAHQKRDPTGYQTLQKVLGTRDMKAFKTKWEKYVLNLSEGFEVTILPGGD